MIHIIYLLGYMPIIAGVFLMGIFFAKMVKGTKENKFIDTIYEIFFGTGD